MGADVDDVGQVAQRLERLREYHAVVGLRWRREFRPLRGVIRPLKVAAIHDGAADVDAVAAEELRGRVDGDIDAVLERAEEGRREHGVIHDHRQSVLVRDIRKPAEVRHVVLRVSHRLEIDQARVLIGEPADLLGVVGIEEPHFDAQLLERLGEQRPRPPVQTGGGKEVLARVRDGENGRGDGGLPRGESQRPDSAI